MEEKTATLTCERHGNATPLSCVRCEKPICWGCLVETDVGFMCEKHGGQARRAKSLRSDRRQRRVVGAGALVAVMVAVLLLRRAGDIGSGPRPARPVVYETVTASLIDNPGFEGGAGDGGLPAGWEVRNDGYEGGVDAEIRHGGTASGRIRAVATAESTRRPPGLVSCFDAEQVAGSTVRLRGFLRTEDATGSLTGLAIEVTGRRLDGSDGLLNTANMRNLPIRGSTDWREYILQLPVPLDAESVCVGALLTGRGTLWLDDVTLEVAGRPQP